MNKLAFINEKEDKIINILLRKDFSYNHACKLLRNKDVRVDGVKISDNLEIAKGSEIVVFYENLDNVKNIEKVYEDENIVIINKPQGAEVTGESGLAKKLGLIAVHRLDRNTTGLMIFAKNEIAAGELISAIKTHKIEKVYIAEVVGNLKLKNQVLTAYHIKDSKNSFVKIYSSPVKNCKEIVTKFNTLKSSPSSSTIECTLITGRTHQIRAHLAFLGHPIIGDGKYGKNEDNKKFGAKYQHLHCYRLIFHVNGMLSYLNDKEFLSYPDFYKPKEK